MLKKRTVIGLLMAAVFMLTVGICGCAKEEAPFDSKSVASIRATLEQCKKDMNSCLGGFMRFKKGGRILRINNCKKYCSEHAEIDVHKLILPMPDTRINRIEFVILPDKAGWDVAAAAHARQFVVKR